MRISDWSSDVCSSDLAVGVAEVRDQVAFLEEFHRDQDVARGHKCEQQVAEAHRRRRPERNQEAEHQRMPHDAVERAGEDRKSVAKGKSVSVRVDLGGRRIIKKKMKNNTKNKYKHQEKQH